MGNDAKSEGDKSYKGIKSSVRQDNITTGDGTQWGGLIIT